MFGTRRFMDGTPMLGRGVFESLGQQAPIVVTTPAPTVVQPVIVESPSALMQVGTLAVIAGVGFLALELTGFTHVLGIRKLMK